MEHSQSSSVRGSWRSSCSDPRLQGFRGARRTSTATSSIVSASCTRLKPLPRSSVPPGVEVSRKLERGEQAFHHHSTDLPALGEQVAHRLEVRARRTAEKCGWGSGVVWAQDVLGSVRA